MNESRKLSFRWTQLVNGVDDIEATPINNIANAVLDTQRVVNSLQTPPTKLSQLKDDVGYAKVSDIPQIPTKVSAFTNDAGYITVNENDLVSTFGDYNNFYVGIAGNYADVSNWQNGHIVKIENTNIPPLYYQRGTNKETNVPASEEEFISILETQGFVKNYEGTFRKYSEILGGDFGDVEAALDGILAIQQSLMGGETA